MKKVATLLPFIFWLTTAQAQSIVGKWQTVDDNSGEVRSVIELFEKSGRIFGKVVSIHFKPGENTDPVCDKCEEKDPRFKKKIIGMEILQHMIKKGEEYTEGEILDPENGKVYRCKIWLEGKFLKVRGYWGPFYRTQSWHRTE